MAFFNSIAEVEVWARQHGGLDGVKEALANGTFGSNPQRIKMAILYVEREELRIASLVNREQSDRHTREASAVERFAHAAQRSAHEANISRWVSIVAAVIAVIAAVFTTIRW